MNRIFALMGVFALIALPACTTADPEEAAAPRPSTSALPSSSPSPAGESAADRQVRIERAALTTADLDGTSFRVDDGQPPTRETLALGRCDAALGAERWSSGGYRTSWSEDETGVSVNQYVTGFVREGAAADLVTEARAELATCDTYVLSGYTVVLLGEQPVADVAESGLGFCEKFGDEGLGWCTVILASGDVLTRLQVLAPSVEAAEPVMVSMAALAGPKLAAARR